MSMTESFTRYATANLCALIVLTLVQPVAADTTVRIQGIGTSLAGAHSIDTYVDRVTFSEPASVVVQGIPTCEVRGTVSGVGWGGDGIVSRANSAHYEYDIPFVARWPNGSRSQRLVFFNHGGGVKLMIAIQREKLVGVKNANRSAELNGDLLAGSPAILDDSAYISINRRGLRRDGSFSATYLSEVSPLTAAEVAALDTELASSPGDASFRQPGLSAGAPVPLVPTNDTVTCRDIARALQMIVAQLVGRPFRTRIGVGTSSGARLFASLNFGRSVIGSSSVRTGGNRVVPYDASSPQIFDGFILNGFPYIPNVEHVDSIQPLSAPTILIQGQGDERYQQHITLAHELMQKGVTRNGTVWIYEVKNLVHVTRDNSADVPPPSDGDRLGCFISSAIRNLRRWIECRQPLPCSRMAGRIVEGALRFDQVGGGTTDFVPVTNAPAIDSVTVDKNLTPRAIGPDETKRWQAVTAVLPRVPDAITPPTVTCRLGGYQLKFFGAQLVPEPPAVLRSKYGSFNEYSARVGCAVACLATQGLYDPRLESAQATAELARELFQAP